MANPGPRPRPFRERFWALVDRSAGLGACWPWTGTTHKGYGKAGPDERGRKNGAHRIAYEFAVGPIPAGAVIDHECHDPATCPGGDSCPHRSCCNPAHLVATTQERNRSRERGHNPLAAGNAAKTHCPAGHPYEGDNLIVWADGLRRCRTCRASRRPSREDG